MLSDLVRLGKLLTSPVRVRLLCCIRVDELCMCELLSTFADVPRFTLQAELNLLVDSGLVEKGKIGKWRTFRLTSSGHRLVGELLDKYSADTIWDPKVAHDLWILDKRIAMRTTGMCGTTGLS